MSELYLRDQTRLLNDLRRDLNDNHPTNPKRYTDEQLKRALNSGLDEWVDRVYVPFVHSLEFATGTVEYELPQHVSPPFDIYQRARLWGWVNIPSDMLLRAGWRQLWAYEVQPNGRGGHTLHLHQSVPGGDGYLVYWAANGQLPEEAVELSASIDDDDTELVLDSNPDVGHSGYVKIGGEMLAYSGFTDDGSQLTLTNLQRGVMNTAAASHSAGANVLWVVAANSNRLYRQLIEFAQMKAHEQYMQTGAAGEKDTHGQMIRLYEERADKFWRSYMPMRQPKMVLDQRARGIQSPQQWLDILLPTG